MLVSSLQAVKDARAMQAEQRKQLKEITDSHKAAQKRKRDEEIARLCEENTAAASAMDTGAAAAAQASTARQFNLPAELQEYRGDPADRCAPTLCLCRCKPLL